MILFFFFFSSRRRHTRYWRDWSSDVCSSDLPVVDPGPEEPGHLGADELVDEDPRGREPHGAQPAPGARDTAEPDRKSTRLNLQSRQYLVCRLLLEKKKKER